MSNTFVLDSNYLARKRKEIKNEISYARYQVGGNWYQAKIETATVLSDGRVEATFVIDHTVSGNITVTGVELYDLNGARIGSKTVSISRKDAVEGILYVCRFSLFHVKENSSKTGAYDAL